MNGVKIGTTQAVISRIENGNVNIGIDTIQKIAKAFGITARLSFNLTVKDKIRKHLNNDNQAPGF